MREEDEGKGGRGVREGEVGGRIGCGAVRTCACDLL